MSDDWFAKRVAARLDEATDHLEGRITRRLRSARECALRAQPASSRRWWDVRGRAQQRTGTILGPALASGAALVVALVMFSGGATDPAAEFVGGAQDIDAALLMDELPIEAYLDADFRAWLLRDS